ncbi:hypothetical protein QTP88_028983 [Uroleucon formosanum]
MATGESLRSLAFSFRISQGYISRIIPLVVKSLSLRLTPLLLAPPTKNNLIHIAEEFWTKWNFPNCTGTIDGKHIRIFCPGKSGSSFFKYKDFFSVVLLAIVDANCKFIFVDIGAYGKEGDSGIFTKSSLYKQIQTGEYFPRDAKLPNCEKSLPYVHVGDEAFRLETHMMRSYTRALVDVNHVLNEELSMPVNKELLVECEFLKDTEINSYLQKKELVLIYHIFSAVFDGNDNLIEDQSISVNNESLVEYEFLKDTEINSYDMDMDTNKNDPAIFAKMSFLSLKIKDYILKFDLCQPLQDDLPNKINLDKSWTKERFNKWKNCSFAIQRHKLTPDHVTSSLKFNLRQKNIAMNRHVVLKLIDIVIYMGHHNLAFRGHFEYWSSNSRGNFKDLVMLMSKNSGPLAEHINQCLAATFDSSRKEQISFIIRYAVEVTGDVHERLLAVKELPVTSEKNVYDIIVNVMEAENLNWKEELVGQSYDGATNMRGNYKGLQAHIKAESPQALFVGIIPIAWHW